MRVKCRLNRELSAGRKEAASGRPFAVRMPHPAATEIRQLMGADVLDCYVVSPFVVREVCKGGIFLC